MEWVLSQSQSSNREHFQVNIRKSAHFKFWNRRIVRMLEDTNRAKELVVAPREALFSSIFCKIIWSQTLDTPTSFSVSQLRVFFQFKCRMYVAIENVIADVLMPNTEDAKQLLCGGGGDWGLTFVRLCSNSVKLIVIIPIMHCRTSNSVQPKSYGTAVGKTKHV